MTIEHVSCHSIADEDDHEEHNKMTNSRNGRDDGARDNAHSLLEVNVLDDTYHEEEKRDTNNFVINPKIRRKC